MKPTALQSPMAATSITTAAPAKINLTLHVLGTRPDGFHNLESLVVGVDLCDRVRCGLLSQTGLEVNCTDSSLANRDNLATRAVELLAQHIGREANVRIEIEKCIPIGTGLGGGSSDAAAALRLCNHLWDADLGNDELARIGAEIGSDVPLFFSLPAAVMAGRGERVQPVTMQWSGWVLLVLVDAFVSTADVYRDWHASEKTEPRPNAVQRMASAATADDLSPLLVNDLTPAVMRVCSAVAEIHKTLKDAGLGTFHVTGSGSTMYRLFDDRDVANRIANEIKTLNLAAGTAVAAAPVNPGGGVNEE